MPINIREKRARGTGVAEQAAHKGRRHDQVMVPEDQQLTYHTETSTV